MKTKTKLVVVDQPRCEGNLNGVQGNILKFRLTVKNGCEALVRWDAKELKDSWEALKDIGQI